MSAAFRPDYGLALVESGSSAPVEISPLVLEDIGRVDEDTYTIAGQVLHLDEWHMASVDLSSHLLPQLLAALPGEAATAVGKLLRRPWRGPFVEKLAAPESLSVLAEFGELQDNGQERFVPFIGLRVSPGPALALVPGETTEKPVEVELAQEVLLLQVEPTLGAGTGLGAMWTAAGVFVATLEAAFAEKPRKQPWTCFLTQQEQFSGLTLWMGVTAKVPGELLDRVQANLESLGTEVHRAMGRADQLRMLPVSQIGPGGTSLLYPLGAKPPPSRLVDMLRQATGVDLDARPFVNR